MMIQHKHTNIYQVMENGIVIYEGTWKECQKFMSKRNKK